MPSAEDDAQDVAADGENSEDSDSSDDDNEDELDEDLEVDELTEVIKDAGLDLDAIKDEARILRGGKRI